MAPKKPDDDDSMPPSEDDEDDEKSLPAPAPLPAPGAAAKAAAAAPATSVPKVKNLPKGGNDDEAPTAPLLSPREKFINKSRQTTPREKAGAPAADGDLVAAGQAAAGAAMDEFGKARLPTGEELAQAQERAAAQAKETAEAFKGEYEAMMAELPPTKLPDAEKMDKYIEDLAKDYEGAAPSGLVAALKPCLLMCIRVFLVRATAPPRLAPF